MRTFLAIPLAMPDSLRPVYQQLANMGGPVRCVREDHLHITVKFFGETTSRQLTQMRAVMADLPEFSGSDAVSLQGLGCFPSLERPEVLWAGLAGTATLCELAAWLETETAAFGFPPERRPFHPHLTLARIKYRPDPRVLEFVRGYAATAWGVVTLPELVLFQSELLPDGPRYTRLTKT